MKNNDQTAKKEVNGGFSMISYLLITATLGLFLLMHIVNNGIIYYIFQVLFWFCIAIFVLSFIFYHVTVSKLSKKYEYEDYVDKGMKYLNRKIED
jgi:uncharacterized Tic20 family protein